MYYIFFINIFCRLYEYYRYDSLSADLAPPTKLVSRTRFGRTRANISVDVDVSFLKLDIFYKLKYIKEE